MLTKLKKFITPPTFILFVLFSLFPVWGASDDDFTSIPEAQPIIERIFNITFASAAAVLVAVVAYGIWKSSLATGDPRGLEGAKQTWTYALYGFMVIVLFFAIFAILQGIFGIDVLTPRTLLDKVFEAVSDILNITYRSGRGY